jgi:hypothetical protein
MRESRSSDECGCDVMAAECSSRLAHGWLLFIAQDLARMAENRTTCVSGTFYFRTKARHIPEEGKEANGNGTNGNHERKIPVQSENSRWRK